MREISFRALSKADKQMFDVDYMKLDFGKVPYVNGEVFSENDGWITYELDDDDFELMQYTGLKDKNGVEIYEGDIIKAKFIKDSSEITGWVEYFDKDASFICHLKGGDYALLVALSELEVIGDIYNNKEFLRG